MNPLRHTSADAALVARQMGRIPREPWRVVATCDRGFPSVIASPSVLDDGTPFPTCLWLTCPWMVEIVGRMESDGSIGAMETLIATDSTRADRLNHAETALRHFREQESEGEDPCAATGIAGQRKAMVVKCLHAHTALFLYGIDDPIGADIVALVGSTCEDGRCAGYVIDEG